MRRISSLLICVLLIVALAIPAFAANETVFTITANKTSAGKGEEITFTVSVKGTEPCKSLGLVLNYDKTKLELVSGQCTMDSFFSDFSADKGFALMFKDATAPDGVVGTFTMKVIDECPANAAVNGVSSVKNGSTTIASSVKGATVAITGEHAYDAGKVTTEPDCDTEGVKTFTCANCGHTKTEAVAALGHTSDEGEVTTKPDCENKGVKTYSCTVCGETVKTEEIAALGHKSDNGAVTTEPDCENKGVKTYSCTVCGETVKTEEIPALGHKSDDGKVTTAPDCDSKGVKTYSCTVCGETVKTEEIPALGHTSDEGKVTTKPDCENKGVKTYSCTVCGETVKTEEIAAVGHIPAEDAEITKQPTCEETGMMTGKCSVCGKTLKDEVIPALGHDYELTETIDPTCDEAGSKTYVCKNDSKHTYTEEIAALGHTYGEWADNPGHDNHIRTCSVCGGTETADHVFDKGTVDLAPTCVEPGSMIYKCTVCGFSYAEAIPATGIHEPEEYVINEDGTHTGTCACGEVIVEKHEYEINGEVLEKPTTKKEGKQEKLCVCGDKTVVTLPKVAAGLDKVPGTGDITAQITMVAVVIVAMFAAAVVMMKRRVAK